MANIELIQVTRRRNAIRHTIIQTDITGLIGEINGGCLFGFSKVMGVLTFRLGALEDQTRDNGIRNPNSKDDTAFELSKKQGLAS